jgi:putative ABC transport system ATP-binding protein
MNLQRPVAATGDAEAPRHLIELRGVSKIFETVAGDFPALDGIDFDVSGGEFVAVVGKSGSGKSTLLNMIAGIDRPSSGTVRVDGVQVDQLSEGLLARWRGKSLGVVFQFFQLLPTLTAIENVLLPMDFAGIGRPAERSERARHLLELVDLSGHADKLPSTLSGGEQQRVAIARAMANDPPLIVADEPTGNLDSRTADAVFALFENLVSAGKTILFVTHDRDLSRRGTRRVEIADGRILVDERLSHDVRAGVSQA